MPGVGQLDFLRISTRYFTLLMTTRVQIVKESVPNGTRNHWPARTIRARPTTLRQTMAGDMLCVYLDLSNMTVKQGTDKS